MVCYVKKCKFYEKKIKQWEADICEPTFWTKTEILYFFLLFPA